MQIVSSGFLLPAGRGADMRFAYHRSIAPMMWVFVALATIEILVVHFLIGIWWPFVALILSVLSVLGLFWLVRQLLSFKHLPVEIGEASLVWRVGTLRSVTIPFATIAGIRREWSGDAIKSRDVLNLALIAYPNVLLDLKEPIIGKRGRQIHAVAHKLDDPAAFLAALEKRL